MKKLTTICIALALSGCYSRAPTNQQAGHQELVVAAAANLTDAFAEIGSRLPAKRELRVVFSFGATAELAKQIENGAPFDVFAAADTEHVDLARIVPACLHRALGALWLADVWCCGCPPGSSLKVGKVEDITAKQFDRIAIAKTDVAPYGQAAVDSLKKLGIWNEIEHESFTHKTYRKPGSTRQLETPKSHSFR